MLTNIGKPPASAQPLQITAAAFSPALRAEYDRLVERINVLSGTRGDKLDAAVTFRDLKALGLGSGGDLARASDIATIRKTFPSTLQKALDAGVANIAAGAGSAYTLDINTGDGTDPLNGSLIYRHIDIDETVPPSITPGWSDSRPRSFVASGAAGTFMGYYDKDTGSRHYSLAIDGTTGSAVFTGTVSAAAIIAAPLNADTLAAYTPAAGYTGVYFDATGIHGYKAGAQTVHIANNGDAIFNGTVGASAIMTAPMVTDDLTPYTPPADYTGVYFDATGIHGYKLGTQTVHIANNGDAIFNGTVGQSAVIAAGITSKDMAEALVDATGPGDSAVIMDKNGLFGFYRDNSSAIVPMFSLVVNTVAGVGNSGQNLFYGTLEAQGCIIATGETFTAVDGVVFDGTTHTVEATTASNPDSVTTTINSGTRYQVAALGQVDVSSSGSFNNHLGYIGVLGDVSGAGVPLTTTKSMVGVLGTSKHTGVFGAAHGNQGAGVLAYSAVAGVPAVDAVAGVDAAAGGLALRVFGGMQINNTQLVANLNAERLGGYLASDFALSGHQHGSTYAYASHDHGSTYAYAVHNHDGVYSDVGHNHSGVYANSSHTHTIADIAQSFTWVKVKLSDESNNITKYQLQVLDW